MNFKTLQYCNLFIVCRDTCWFRALDSCSASNHLPVFFLTCRYPAVFWPWWVLEKYVPGYSSAWVRMGQISNLIIVLQGWSPNKRDTHGTATATDVIWLYRRGEPLLVITEGSPLLPWFQSRHIFPACSFNHSRLSAVNHLLRFYCAVHAPGCLSKMRCPPGEALYR